MVLAVFEVIKNAIVYQKKYNCNIIAIF